MHKAECKQSQALPPSIQAGPLWEHGILANPCGGVDENANKGLCGEMHTPSVYVLVRNATGILMCLSTVDPLFYGSV